MALASNRAMKNGQVMLYDLNYVGANLILFIKEMSCFMVAPEAVITSEVTSDLEI